MGTRLSALFTAGFSALLISGVASPQIAHADDSPAERSAELEEKQAAKNEEEWKQIANDFCDGAIDPRKDLEGSKRQFSDEAIELYDKGYRLSPLEYDKGDDPVDYARKYTMTKLTIKKNSGKGKQARTTEEEVDFSPPVVGWKDDDRLRFWRYLVCEVDDFKAAYDNALKVADTEMKPKLGKDFGTDGAILALYDKKMAILQEAVKKAAKDRGDS
ncbi:hypothetical protein [Nocardia sp. NPDC050175]|uniref:hypothetical protein n=1 Tax=Nocardia sp. NPDC050175 TaxID=3364317 RepID=UPI00379C64C0